jgi:hypothetical protein
MAAEKTPNRFLDRMVQRLYASLSSGPSMNCRPHASRQRVDLVQLTKLDRTPAIAIVRSLVGSERSATLRVVEPSIEASGDPERDERARIRKVEEQQAILARLRTIAEDARTFEQDTGAQALHVGLPLLNLPPTAAAGRRAASSRRVLAPIAFIPINLTVKTGRAPSVTIEATGEGAELVEPNTALLSWIEGQTGTSFGELFSDPEGTNPWREIDELVRAVCAALDLPAFDVRSPELDIAATLASDEEDAKRPQVSSSAVLGLYPLSNQSLLHDLEAMAEGDALSGPVQSFLFVEAPLAAPPSGPIAPATPGLPTGDPPPIAYSDPPAAAPAGERLVSSADPCQVRAVRLARSARGLVIHGPPGTGKSQTITNVIGDHLARGERVLFVCDKRTAIDVVQHRLEHLGLGGLCAIVHDAQRDRRDLYMGVREQLDALAEAKLDPAARPELEAVERELESIHDELARFARAISEPRDGSSFHDLVGEWLEIDAGSDRRALGEVDVAALVGLERGLLEVFERAQAAGYPTNPWRQAAGLDLEAYLAQPESELRRKAAQLRDLGRAADETLSDAILPFASGEDLAAAAEARGSLAAFLRDRSRGREVAALARFVMRSSADLGAARERLAALESHREVLARGPLDPELMLVLESEPIPIARIVEGIGKLEQYLDVAKKWFAFFAFKKRREAGEILARFGLKETADAAERVLRLLEGLRARALLAKLLEELDPPAGRGSDGELSESLSAVSSALAVLEAIDGADGLRPIQDALRMALADPARHGRVIDGLDRSVPRARAITALEVEVVASKLFRAPYVSEVGAELRGGRPVHDRFVALERRLPTLEGLLRIDRVMGAFPPALRDLAILLCESGAGVEDGIAAVRKSVLAGALERRLRESPELVAIDDEGVNARAQRVRALTARRRELVVRWILHRWTERQRDRLLATTGSRLNNAGAELRRRLLLRGDRAMRLRQVVASGAGIEGGDPLFDLRPVWMASPETVAQIFPREPLFDVLIFDEASQCRIEEALPVLTRAKRVVVAGDPKQLPPTRFFESAIAQSREDDAETDQELFEEQQSEVEDLLAAALNLEVEQCYLDVHYRSRNSDLIEFSNQSFYQRRLQPIPGHPKNRAEHPPLRLVRVAGVYEKQKNLVEAEAVVSIVKQLLARDAPPSIGIACMNLHQKDAIREALDAAAAADPAFGGRLAGARKRRGAASFEGLFVKNLESVQGDERDHMIVSTTYGPDPKGRFYRRFGPLGRAGGGRRLNVLVTRARDEVHLVTSIPREHYASLPPIEPGRTPNGGWLLFSYLRYAELLEQVYAELAANGPARAARESRVSVAATGAPSRLAEAFARALSARGHSSDVYWGNDGFSIDLAIAHPIRPDDVTIGVLLDWSRYPRAHDRVEWDLFRTEILQAQGWDLQRIWAPSVYRDPDGAIDRVARASKKRLEKEPWPVLPSAAEPHVLN